MKKFYLLACAMIVGAAQLSHADEKIDSARLVQLQNVEVVGTRATTTTPIAFTNVTHERLVAENHGLDIPFLLSGTPSVTTTSDAGGGIGYSSFRVRGVDPTRINITANDIPLNDAESHEIYWVNTPDLASSLSDVQIQRGVGTSTNGSGAFGATLNMRTQQFSASPFALVSGSYGSFNANKETFSVGSGLLRNHWAFEARLSHISSDGYRDRASTALASYFAQGGYFYHNGSLRFITFGGKEKTYHAWDGISREMLSTDRTYNPNGEIKHGDAVTGFYDDQNDNYRQTHYQLIWNHSFNSNWKANVALHYTDGYGFYQEYKNRRTLKEYALENIVAGSDVITKSNLVRKKIVDSGFGGMVFSVNYDDRDRFNATLGGGMNRYVNDHYGRVIWVENYSSTLEPDHEYYRNKGEKNDFSIYLKGNYRIWKQLSAYADVQLRHIDYTIKGINDKWDWTASPEQFQVLNIDEKFSFVNPHAGLHYQITPNHTAYASFGVAQKEPTRNNYTDGPFIEHPKAEKMYDYELGYRFVKPQFGAGINLYYMDYHDQLVLNGKLNEIGEAIVENVPHSYRAGIELTAFAQPLNWFRWEANATLSRNCIKNYVGYVSDYDSEWNELWTQTAIEKGNTTIAMSPSVIVSNTFRFEYKGFNAQVLTRYVSRQYLDNFESRDDSLDPYCVTDIGMAYTFALPSVKALTLGVTVYNVFNTKYENNGYSQTAAVYEGGKSGTMTLASDPRFYPMAGINALAHITLLF